MATGAVAQGQVSVRPWAGALLWAGVAAAVMWDFGAHVDAWYHVHYGFAIDSFFTAPHALLYTGWLIFGAVAVLRAIATAGPERRLFAAPGSLLMVAGACLFGMGGVFDFVWHSLFGFEVNLETLMTPSHQWLVASFVVSMLGLLQAGQYARRERAQGWLPQAADLLVMVPLALLFRAATWNLGYSEPSVDYAAGGFISARSGALEGQPVAGILGEIAGTSGLILHSVLLALFVVALPRRLRLPAGSIALIMVTDAALIAWTTDQWSYLTAVAGAAVVGEAIWALMWHGRFGGLEGRTGYWLLAWAVPAVQAAFRFGTMAAVSGGLVWPVHLWAGAPVLAGFYGLAVGLLLVPPGVFILSGAQQDELRRT